MKLGVCFLFNGPELAAEFGVPEGGKHPKLRVVALLQAGTMRWKAAAVGGYHGGENTLADQLEGALGPGQLSLADRGFFSIDRWLCFSAAGAHQHLPRPAAELEQLASYYDNRDTSVEMEHGTWVEPEPMAITSLRLPADVISQLKRQAQARPVRYTTYARSILERAADGTPPPDMTDITERLERIERAVTGGHGTSHHKMA